MIDQPPPPLEVGGSVGPEALLAALAGVAVGLAAGLAHQRLLSRSIDRALDQRRPALLVLSAPLRLALPVAALFGLAQWRLAGLVGGFVGLALALLWARKTAPPAPPPATPRAPTPVDEEAPR